MPQFINDTVRKNQESPFMILKQFHNLLKQKQLFFLVLLLLIPSIEAQCYTSYTSDDNGNKTCTICLSGGNFQNCTYNKYADHRGGLNQIGCNLYCCGFNYQTTIKFCISADQASTTDNSKLATIIIVIFFTIPATVCFCIFIISCMRRRAERLERIAANNDPPASSINLADYNIDQIGPLFQDKKQSCSICLQESGNLRTKCGHIYHPQCLLSWVHKKSTCPLCVSREFNPIILYCTKCFKSVKMAVLSQSVNSDALQQLRSSQNLLCEACTGYSRHQDEISIDIEIVSEKNEEKEKQRQGTKNKIKQSELSQSALSQQL